MTLTPVLQFNVIAGRFIARLKYILSQEKRIHTDLLGVLQDKGYSVDVMNIDDVVYYTTDTMKRISNIWVYV